MNEIESSQPVALVSGASGGIGESICRHLVDNGYRVVAAARNQERLQALAQALGDRLYPLLLDVTDAAAGGRRLFEQGSADQWCDIIETNVQGMIRLTHALIDGMLARGCGHIVNMGSIAGLKPYASGTAYVSSKYAVHGFSETLRLDYAGRGIRVTEIMPGLVRSGFAEQRLGDARQAQEFYDSFEQCLDPEDVARTVLFALQQPAHVEIAQLVVLPVSG